VNSGLRRRLDNSQLCSYNVIVKITWSDDKNAANKAKHGISFEEAAEVFNDPLHLAFIDERFEYGEERWITIGQIGSELIIVAAHTYMDAGGNETIRIISARKATRRERRQYEKYEI
jgi:uncharacterized DUF497 family protein